MYRLKVIGTLIVTLTFFSAILCTVRGDSDLEKLRELKNSMQESEKQNPQWLFRIFLWQGHIALEQKEYSSALSQYEKAERYAKRNNLVSLLSEAVISVLPFL